MFVLGRAVYFFTGWGVRFGAALGLLSGTLILPIFGSGHAVVWGFGLGLLLGIVTGAVAGVVSWLWDGEEGPQRRVRRTLTLFMGIFTALAAAALVFLSTEGIFWYTQIDGRRVPNSNEWINHSSILIVSPYLYPSLLAALIWAGLAAAYTSQRYLDYRARLAAGEQPDEQNGNPFLYDIENDTLTFWIESFFKKHVMAILLAGMIGGFVTPGAYMVGALAGLIVGSLGLLLLAVTNATLLIFVNRIVFMEYWPDLPLRRYQWAVGALTALVTAGIIALAAVGYLAPLPGWLMQDPITQQPFFAALLLAVMMGIGAWRTAQQYGSWYATRWQTAADYLARQQAWLEQHKPKAKRSEADMLQDLFDGVPVAKRLPAPPQAEASRRR